MTLAQFIGAPISDRIELLLGYDTENMNILLEEIGQHRLVFNDDAAVGLLTVALVVRKASGEAVQIVMDETEQLQNVFEGLDIVRVHITFFSDGADITIPFWIPRISYDEIVALLDEVTGVEYLDSFRDHIQNSYGGSVDIYALINSIRSNLPSTYSLLLDVSNMVDLYTYFPLPQGDTTSYTSTASSASSAITLDSDTTSAATSASTSSESTVISDVETTPEDDPEESTIDPLPQVAQELNETARFQGAPWFTEVSKQVSVAVIGVGGIGSWASFLLARLNPRDLTLIDGDVVEGVNMSGQLHPATFVGYPKVRSMREIIYAFCNRGASTYSRRVESDIYTFPSATVTVCGLDNMESRKLCFQHWCAKRNHIRDTARNKYIFIDGRLTATEFQVFAITGDNEHAIEEYRNRWLFDDDAAEATVCSFKQTSHLAAMIGAVITNIVTNFVTNYINDGVLVTEVPFKTEFNASTMTLKIE